MTEQPTSRPDEDTPQDDPPPLQEVPPVAGGTDDSPPAQGEGEHDSW
jgi:hypothetical protein